MAFQGDSIFWVEVEKIVPNPYQPRREFDEGKLGELAESIRMYGVLQPLTVTRKEIQRDDGGLSSEYELISGERRLRASRLAGLLQVPVIIRSGEQSEKEKLELAIIENLQREDLNPVDRAFAFKQLADDFGMSHKQIAQKVGRSRMYVTNTMRLLNLPEEIIESLKRGKVSEGHARTLLMLNDRPEEQNTLYRETMLKKLSVRDVERLARKIAVDKIRKKNWEVDPEIIEIEKALTDTLGTRVQISRTDFGGKLTIDYFSPEDLQKIVMMVAGGHERGQTLDSDGRNELARADTADELLEPADAMLSGEETEVADIDEHTEPSTPAEGEAPMESDESEEQHSPEDDRSEEEKTEDEETDDPDLYSIRNFSL